jgi:N6-L-threonylcarbamoyladenine synthase
VAYPYLLLLVSGGHCQLLAIEGVGQYRRLGTTIDDAAGEAFDKTAKLLGLGYPGGPAVEQAATKGTAGRFSLPRPLIRADNCNFSFSGLKTAVRRQVETLKAEGKLDDGTVADIAAEFQAAVCDCLADRSKRAMALFRGTQKISDSRQPVFVVAGGVAANSAIKIRLAKLAAGQGFRFVAPPVWLCTDNAAMIAWAGVERFALGLSDPLDAPARARWPLDESAGPMVGSGKRGAKV